ncbi:MAG: RHS repeat-associated core domain-containing protein, partial [Pseudomonadota bacterium]
MLKSGPQGITHFHYDLAGHLIAETDSNGTPIREYLWLGDTPVGLVAIRNAGTQAELFAVHADHLDTALLLTDSTQAVVWRYHREPFGELTAGNNTVRWPLRFPGQYEDQETGIFYNYFRDYDSQVGRYIQSDPVGLSADINTYAYVMGNPVMNTDP